jgi:hypothetical protein
MRDGAAELETVSSENRPSADRNSVATGEAASSARTSSPTTAEDPPTIADGDRYSEISLRGFDESRRRLFPGPSTTGEIIRFPAPITDETGTHPAFIYAFSDNIEIKPNALYNPEMRGAPPSVESRIVKANSRYKDRGVAVSVARDFPAIVQRLDGDRVVYPESSSFCTYQSSVNLEHGELRLPLPLTLEELFRGVTKRVSFSRIIGRNKSSGVLLRESVAMNIWIEPGVRAEYSILYARAGNKTKKGSQDLRFVVYEV